MGGNYVNPLPGVPNVESPFFDELFHPADEHYAVALALRENGFAVIDFPDPEIDALAEDIRRSLHDRYDWPAWARGEPGSLRLGDAWKANSSVRRIAVNERMIDILSYLYGRRAFPFQTLNFPVGTQQHFHSDSVHFSCRPERFMCGVWVALEDVGPDQGPLLYYPGSHRWPIYGYEHVGYSHDPSKAADQSTLEPMWRRLVEANGVRPQRFFARKGQALIWAANLLHGGDLHADRSKTRWSQAIHYFFEECVYYTPLYSNEPRGEIYRRTPVDIASGKRVPGRFNGEKAARRYLRTAIARASLANRLKRRLGRVLRRGAES